MNTHLMVPPMLRIGDTRNDLGGIEAIRTRVVLVLSEAVLVLVIAAVFRVRSRAGARARISELIPCSRSIPKGSRTLAGGKRL